MSRKWLSGVAVLAAIALVLAGSVAAQGIGVAEGKKAGIGEGKGAGIGEGKKAGTGFGDSGKMKTAGVPGMKDDFPGDSPKLATTVPGEKHAIHDGQQKGETPLTQDEEMKMYALNGLRQATAQEAVPMLEKFLAKNESLRLKEKALSVLASFETQSAREALVRVARDASQPQLQLRAIRCLGNADSAEARKALTEIYGTTQNADAKKAVLKALHNSEDRGAIRNVAANDADPELRSYAIRLLGSMDAREDLRALYGVEKSAEVKTQIMRAMSAAGDAAQLVEIARNEPDPKLRRQAIRWYGNSDDPKSGEMLAVIYAAEKDVEVKKEVITAFVRQDNIKQLIAVARQEADPELKKYAVSRLAQSRSKEASDYLVELLNK